MYASHCKLGKCNGLGMLLVQVLSSGLTNATLVRAACSLLCQLADSAAIKAEIVNARG